MCALYILFVLEYSILLEVVQPRKEPLDWDRKESITRISEIVIVNDLNLHYLKVLNCPIKSHAWNLRRVDLSLPGRRIW